MKINKYSEEISNNALSQVNGGTYDNGFYPMYHEGQEVEVWVSDTSTVRCTITKVEYDEKRGHWRYIISVNNFFINILCLDMDDNDYYTAADFQ